MTECRQRFVTSTLRKGCVLWRSSPREVQTPPGWLPAIPHPLTSAPPPCPQCSWSDCQHKTRRRSSPPAHFASSECRPPSGMPCRRPQTGRHRERGIWTCPCLCCSGSGRCRWHGRSGELCWRKGWSPRGWRRKQTVAGCYCCRGGQGGLLAPVVLQDLQSYTEIKVKVKVSSVYSWTFSKDKTAITTELRKTSDAVQLGCFDFIFSFNFLNLKWIWQKWPGIDNKNKFIFASLWRWV